MALVLARLLVFLVVVGCALRISFAVIRFGVGICPRDVVVVVIFVLVVILLIVVVVVSPCSATSRGAVVVIVVALSVQA